MTLPGGVYNVHHKMTASCVIFIIFDHKTWKNESISIDERHEQCPG
jgi:hypothetical protein